MSLLTVTQAEALAKERGRPVSAATIKHACANGKLTAQKFGKTWVFTLEDFDVWQAIPRKRGNPNFKPRP